VAWAVMMLLAPSVLVFLISRNQCNHKGVFCMPKIKTNRSAAKRFKKTGTGKITYHKSFGSHILSTKSRKRKRALRKSPLVHQSNLKAVKLLLPNG
jgi:large subunit ribosomal protein L35